MTNKTDSIRADAFARSAEPPRRKDNAATIRRNRQAYRREFNARMREAKQMMGEL